MLSVPGIDRLTPRPFNYSTIEELTESLYSSEKNLSTILSISALFTLLIAAMVVLSTVYIHSHKASRINPVDALRYE